jgi:uncharacterized protein YbjT (DUF2867 family)
MILVTGATGNVGSQAATELREKGIPFRAFVRDPDKARGMLGDDVELAEGDFEDPSSIRRALDGVDTVLLVTATHENQVEHEMAVIDAAAEAGVGRLVKASTVGAEIGSECLFLDRHGRAEEHLRKSGIPWVIVRGSGFYMTNLMLHADPVRTDGKLFANAEGAEIAMIDPRDVGSAEVIPLTTEGYEGQILTLSGPAAITFDDIAKELSRVLRREVVFVPITDEEAVQGMLAAGVPEILATPYMILLRLLRGGMNSMTTNTMRELTEREARSFGEFAEDHAAAFGG